MIKKYFTTLNIVFFISLAGVILIALDIIPRWFAFLIAAAYLLFILFSSLEDSLLLFVRSIPFFIALPITASFDNFNTWRIVLVLIFLKWFLGRWKDIWKKFKVLSLRDCWKNYPIESLAFILFILSFASLFNALNLWIGAKRIIYFVNLAMIFFIAKSLISENRTIFKPLMENILLSAVLVVIFGYLQLISVFFIPIDVFHHWWGQLISLGFYGKVWSDIVMWGNTWFSYTADALKLRVFSTFPDSHSFPLYLLMVLPAFLVVFSQKISFSKLSFKSSSLIRKRIREFDLFLKNRIKKDRNLIIWAIFLVLISFILIMSGTRGIWLSVIFPVIFLFFFAKKFPKVSVLPCFFILVFLLLFTVAPLFYALPQFRAESTLSGKVFTQRIISSFNLKETSNQGRIAIWQKTLKSLLKHPWLGVGIGNFPIVLEESINLAKAGSSAHNLYLNIAAEMGLITLLFFTILLVEIFKKSWQILTDSASSDLKIFAFSSVVFLIWVFGYSLTDAALFDERAFLIFMLVLGIIAGLAEKKYLENI